MTTASPAEPPAIQKKCSDCGREIPVSARRCGHDNCGAFQDWRRFFGGQLNVLTIATAGGVAVSILLNLSQIKDLADKPSKHETETITSAAVGRSLADLRASLKTAEAKLIEVPASHTQASADFLRLPNTGIAK